MRFNVTEKIGYWIDEGIEVHGQGENILWDGIVMSGQNQEPLFTVFIWFPGAMLGTTLNASFQIADVLHIEKKDTVEMMGEFLRHLREARSQILAQQNQQAQQQPPVPPGGAQTPSGLLIP